MLPPPVTWQRRICNTKEKIDRARSVSCPSHCGSNVGGRARRRASGTKDSEPVFACDTHPPLERPAIVTRSRAELHSVLRVPPVAGRILVSCIGPVNDSKPHSDCGTHAVLDPRSLPAFAARSVRRGASPFIRGALHLRSFAASHGGSAPHVLRPSGRCQVVRAGERPHEGNGPRPNGTSEPGSVGCEKVANVRL